LPVSQSILASTHPDGEGVRNEYVCAYLFWNFHERTPGVFKWDGEADIAEFCKIAQEEGLWVILRPGPYTCAEWEMGVYPGGYLRTTALNFAQRSVVCKGIAKLLKEVGHVLASMQITKGGPILMVQVENEYGFFADDAEYMGIMRSAIVDAGLRCSAIRVYPPII